ncbi:hypothetical protein [Nakamurella deserti]|uniref:hypothetical protein n=1 Tax=Nakamurella deserti TaxID=2164074 RepID=UPI00197B1699|nr:hypothetical protein [Nakamurella deserti]
MSTPATPTAPDGTPAAPDGIPAAPDGTPAAPGDTASPTPTSSPGAARLDRVIVGWLTLLVVIGTLYAVLFLPLYLGVVPVPVSALLGAGVVFLAIRLSYRLTGSMLAALAPALGWLVAAVYLSFSRTLGYPLVIGDWRATLLLGVGALAAAVGVGLSWGAHQLAMVARTRAGDGVRPPDVPGVTTQRTPAEH